MARPYYSDVNSPHGRLYPCEVCGDYLAYDGKNEPKPHTLEECVKILALLVQHLINRTT